MWILWCSMSPKNCCNPQHWINSSLWCSDFSLGRSLLDHEFQDCNQPLLIYYYNFSLVSFFFLLMCLISCSVTTKDKLQSQCCVFHAISDKAKYLSSRKNQWGGGGCSSNWCFLHLLLKTKGVWRKGTAAVMFAVTKTERGDDQIRKNVSLFGPVRGKRERFGEEIST